MGTATLTKDLVTITANPTKRKRLEEQSRATQGKKGEHARDISRKWKVYSCNFQLFPFEIPPLKNWPCMSVNPSLILDLSRCSHDRILVQVCAFTFTLTPCSLIPIRKWFHISRRKFTTKQDQPCEFHAV